MITGILVDVSGSMSNKLTKKNVSRTQAVFGSLVNIVKEEDDSKNTNNEMLVLAFGLSDEKYGYCDLINLFELLPSASPEDCSKLLKEYGIKDIESHVVIDDDSSSSKAYIVGHEPLIKMLKQNGASYCDQYIAKHLSKKQAGDLFLHFSKREDLLTAMVDKLPHSCKYGNPDQNTNFSGFDPMKHVFNFLGYMKLVTPEDPEKKEHDEAMDLLKIVRGLISGPVCKIPAKPRQREEIIEIIDKLSLRYKPSSDDNESSSDDNKSSDDNGSISLDINKLISHIEPYIYGNTPMCRSLQYAKRVFEISNKSKVLLIISDGESTDGDPLALIKDFHQKNIIVICCFITSKAVLKPKTLYNRKDDSWHKDAKKMFEMASTVPNSNPAISLLAENGWEIPSSNQSRLFVQADHPDVITEFCRIIHHIQK